MSYLFAANNDATAQLTHLLSTPDRTASGARCTRLFTGGKLLGSATLVKSVTAGQKVETEMSLSVTTTGMETPWTDR